MLLRLITVCLLLLAAPAQAQDALLKLRIEGASKAQRSNIEAYLGTLPTTAELRASYLFSATSSAQKAMQAIGYYHSKVDLKLDKSKKVWQLKLVITPGKATILQAVHLKITGEAEQIVQFSDLAKQHQLIVGEPINHGLYEKAKASLLNQGLQMGFFDSQLLASRIEIDREHRCAEIYLSYDSGPRYRFGEVHFTGSDLEPALLAKMATFKAGEPYDAKKLSQLQSELVDSGYFSEIKLLPQLALRKQGVIPVLAELKPVSSHKVNVGLGYVTNTRARASITWKTPQINRYGHSQETRLEYSEVNPYVRFRYQIPWNHPNYDVIQLGLDLESDEYADLSSTLYSTSVARLSTADGWLRRVGLKYHEEDWSVLDDNFKGEFWLPNITYSKTKRKGNPIDPSSGFRQLYQLHVGSRYLGSDTNLARLVAQFRYVTTLAEKQRLVVRAELGAAYFEDNELDDVPPSLRFYAGGDQSMRGFGYQSLGPTVSYTDSEGNAQKLTTGGRYLAVGSLEYQYYLTEQWRAAAFTDFGNAFDELEQSIEPAYSVGLGAHWLSPVGAIKFDVGYGISEERPPWRLHISMGAEL